MFILPSLVSWLILVCKVKDNQLFPFPDILEDIREECQKYGPVISLLIPKENPGKGQVSEWREEAVFLRTLHVLQDCCSVPENLLPDDSAKNKYLFGRTAQVLS